MSSTLADKNTRRTRTLGLVAIVLVALTVYDYAFNKTAAPVRPHRDETPAVAAMSATPPTAPGTATSPAATAKDDATTALTAPAAPAVPMTAAPRPEGKTGAPPPRGSLQALWREFAELRYLKAHQTEIRQRYQTLAPAYAELVAATATTYSGDQSPKDAAIDAIKSLLAPSVEIRDILIGETGASQSPLQLEATLSLASADSQAMTAGLVNLGNAANGMVWKELSMAADPEKRTLQAKGKLLLLMTRLAE